MVVYRHATVRSSVEICCAGPWNSLREGSSEGSSTLHDIFLSDDRSGAVLYL